MQKTRGSKLLCCTVLKNILKDCSHFSSTLAEPVPFQSVQDCVQEAAADDSWRVWFLITLTACLSNVSLAVAPRSRQLSVHTRRGSYVGGVGCAMAGPLVLHLCTVQTYCVVPCWLEPPLISLWSGDLGGEVVTAIVTGKKTTPRVT